MSHEVLQPMSSLLVNGTHRFASLWKIERKDGVIFRFTDHNQPIDYLGETYTPSGGSVTATARQRRDGTDPTNVTTKGAITSDFITEEDLRSGKYRDAKITETRVDWKYPWLGKYKSYIYYIQETKHDMGEVWQAQISGQLIRLKPNVGHKYTKECRWKKFGDADCGFDLEATVISTDVTSIDEDRRIFHMTFVGTDEQFTDGEVRWTTGQNAGTNSEIKQSLGNKIELQLPTPFPIAAADEFDLAIGCDRLEDTCIRLQGNLDNFGGWPDIPGTNSMLSTPEAL